MLVKPEQYKGISFIRISSLPGEQKTKIKENYDRKSIVKILMDNSLINDCILYDDYVKWFNAFTESRKRSQVPPKKTEVTKSLELIKNV